MQTPHSLLPCDAFTWQKPKKKNTTNPPPSLGRVSLSPTQPEFCQKVHEGSSHVLGGAHRKALPPAAHGSHSSCFLHMIYLLLYPVGSSQLYPRRVVLDYASVVIQTLNILTLNCVSVFSRIELCLPQLIFLQVIALLSF